MLGLMILATCVGPIGTGNIFLPLNRYLCILCYMYLYFVLFINVYFIGFMGYNVVIYISGKW